MEMKEVSPDRYKEKLAENRECMYTLSLNAWQVPLLHGLVTLAADHPEVLKLGGFTREFIQELRRWCRRVFAEWGFSPEEIEYLDRMRVAIAAPKEGNAEESSS